MHVVLAQQYEITVSKKKYKTTLNSNGARNRRNVSVARRGYDLGDARASNSDAGRCRNRFFRKYSIENILGAVVSHRWRGFE